MAVLAAVAGAIAGGGGGEEALSARQATLPGRCLGSDGAAWRRLAGQRIVAPTDGTPDQALLRRAEAGEIAGVIVFPGVGLEQGEIRRGLKRLQEAAAKGGQPPLVVATDQEGGPVKRFINDPPLRAPYDLGRYGDPADARLEGQAAGSFLAGLGINVDLAPVLDVPATSDSVISFRSFGEDAETVTRLGLAFAAGLKQEGVMATAKHFPGIGRSVLNTDFSPSQIDATRRELSEDLRPFEAAIRKDIGLVMVGNASYPELSDKGPAVLSPRIVEGLLRERLGFEGVSISDDLQAGALSTTYDSAEAGERAARAGVDLLLFAGTLVPEVHERLTRALALGRLDPDAARESCARVVALRERLG